MNEPKYTDVRDLPYVELLERCACGQEYVVRLVNMHECRECGLKWLYPPDGIKPANKSWWRRVFWPY